MTSLEGLFAQLPHGLCQFDENDCLVLANRQFQAMYDLPDSAVEPGVFLKTLLASIPREDVRALFVAVIESRLRLDTIDRKWQTDDGRLIAVSCEELENGGYAILHEDITGESDDHSQMARIIIEDRLTQSLNREGFKNEVTRRLNLMKDSDEIALICLDIDRFRYVNDVLGHTGGDLLLNRITEQIRSNIRPTDVVARLGSNEFGVLQVGVSQPAGSRKLTRLLAEEIQEPFSHEGQTVDIAISVGIAISPFDANNTSDLLRDAGLALRRAKRDGGGAVRYFEPAMNERIEGRRKLVRELRGAIENGEFRMVYQPVVDASTSRIVGVEGLVRWHHPVMGRVSPGEFIPLAEDTGLIVPIGEWVLRQACQDAANWPHEVRVAVNVSPVQLRCRSFVNVVESALAAASLPPERLEIEITETSLMADEELATSIITQLSEMGVKVALDDFGTGYSSIRYLQRVPFDKIKIDRSFVSGSDRDQEAAALVRMIAALGVSLAVPTTAEGVETENELAAIRAAGCTLVQGYLTGKPMPPEEVSLLLRVSGEVRA